MREHLERAGFLERWCKGSLVALCALQTGLGVAAPHVMRDAATHKQLALQLLNMQHEDPMQRLSASQGGDPSHNQPKDLLSQSDILCFQGMATLLPRHAVLLLPKAMTGRSVFTAGATLMGWAEFYAQNRGWITTVEVSSLQAAGTLPLAADVTQRLMDGTRVVVATYQGGPISVMPPKVLPPASASAFQTDNPKP